jgi:hypothetical protein
MRRMVLPVGVGARCGEQEHEPGGRDGEQDGCRYHGTSVLGGRTSHDRGESHAVRSRLAAGALLVSVAVLDFVGAHGLAALVLVAAVPTAAGAALLSLGTALETSRMLDRAHAWLGGVVLLLALAAAILRTPLVANHDVPPLAASALTACLIVLAAQALAGRLASLARFRARVGLAAPGS